MQKIKATYDQLDNRQQWLDALRSGNFKQCQLYLETEDGNCCLGVAARVANVSSYQCTDPYETAITFRFPYNGNSLRANDMPPAEWLAERFGLDYKAAQAIMELGAGMNDGVLFSHQAAYFEKRHHSFSEIADALSWAFAVYDLSDCEWDQN